MLVFGWLRLCPATAAAAFVFVVALVVAALPLPVRAAEGGIELAVPYRGQLDGSLYAGSNCGPAALAMVLAGFGRDVPIADVRSTVNNLQRTWGNPDAGTAIENLGVIARQHGLEPLDLADGKRLRRWTLDDVRAHLDAGRPVIPQVWYRGLPGRERRSYNGDHYIVLLGYAGDEFIYHDPVDLDGIGPWARIAAAQLEVAWRESDLPFAALAFAGPPDRPALDPPPTPTPSPTATAPPTATPSPSPTATASPTLTATASPTATVEPTTIPPAVLAPVDPPSPADPAPIDARPSLLLALDPGPAVPLALLLLVAHLAVMAGRWPPARGAAWAMTAHPAVRIVAALVSLAALRVL